MSVSERSPEKRGGKPTGELSELSPGSFSNSPHWLLVRDSAEPDSFGGSGSRARRKLEILSLDTAEGKVLPIFGSEKEAARFAQALSTENEGTEDESAVSQWRARGTGAGELISLLSGSAFSAGACADVESVAFDPPPEVAEYMRQGAGESGLPELVIASRGCFLESLMGRGRPWFEKRD